MSENDISGIHVVNQVNALNEAGASVTIFHFRGRKNPLRYVSAIYRFRKYDLSKYSLVHAHHGQSGIVALSQRLLPVVVTFHGSDLQGIRGTDNRITLAGHALRGVCRLVAMCADEVIIVSEHMACMLPNRTYQVIPAGINLELFRPGNMERSRVQLNLPLDRKLVLFVGDPMRPEKRHSLAEEVVQIVARSFPVELVTAGNAPHEMIPLYMNACDAMLITSSSEGSPAAVKEALACNLPIISVDVGDIRQRIELVDGCAIVENNEAGTIAVTLEGILRQNRRICGALAVCDMDEGLLARRVINIYKAAIVRHNTKKCTGKSCSASND